MSKTALIFAGGRGTRLGDLTAEIPKPLIEVNGRPLISYCIAWAKALGAEKILVSGSYMFEKVEAAVKEIDPSAVMVLDTVFAPGNRILGLISAEGQVEGDLIAFDGDYIYHHAVADFIRSYNYTTVSVHATEEKSEYTAQDVIIGFDEQKHMTEMFKTTGTIDLGSHQGYFNSLLYCPAALTQSLFDVAKKTFEEKKTAGAVHMEDAVVAYNQLVGAVEVVNTGAPLWIEVDNPTELAAAQRFVEVYKEGIPNI